MPKALDGYYDRRVCVYKPLQCEWGKADPRPKEAVSPPEPKAVPRVIAPPSWVTPDPAARSPPKARPSSKAPIVGAFAAGAPPADAWAIGRMSSGLPMPKPANAAKATAARQDGQAEAATMSKPAKDAMSKPDKTAKKTASKVLTKAKKTASEALTKVEKPVQPTEKTKVKTEVKSELPDGVASVEEGLQALEELLPPPEGVTEKHAKDEPNACSEGEPSPSVSPYIDVDMIGPQQLLACKVESKDEPLTEQSLDDEWARSVSTFAPPVQTWAAPSSKRKCPNFSEEMHKKFQTIERDWTSRFHDGLE